MIDRLNAALEGRYRIERELGEGGMATVFLAADLKHARHVAIKVLKPELAAVIGGERFVSEINTMAALQHPHILPLFDSGAADGFLYYVMPFVEGESLRQKLDRESQLSLDDAVATAAAVASALHYAHEKGVIHRDIKPANILIHAGQPVVADFGIALAISAAGGGRLTETGMSVGTPHYMSPEQASADRHVGARSDIYAVACVLYEMLAGEPPHTGSTAQAVLMRILTEEPVSATKHRPAIPPNVDAAIRQALEKLPADRFESADQFKRALTNPEFRYRSRTLPPGPAGHRPVPGEGDWSRDTRTRVLFLANLLLLGMLGVLGWAAMKYGDGGRTNAPAPAHRYVIEDTFRSDVLLDVSRNGDVVYEATVDGREHLRLRRAADPRSIEIPNSDGASFGTFSPDGEWVAFTAEGRLKKVQLATGTTITLVPEGAVPSMTFPHWGADGRILFIGPEGFYRVPDMGGTPELLGKKTEVPTFPRLLPDGRTLLFTEAPAGNFNAARVMIQDLETGDTATIVSSGANALWSPTGHILHGHPSATIFATPFDLERREATGPPVPVQENVFSVGALSFFALSETGALAYIGGSSSGINFSETVFAWLDLDGTTTPIPLHSTDHPDVSLSPEGRRVAYTREGHIFIYDLDRGTNQRFTFEGENHHDPVWSPDGRRLAFTSSREEGRTSDIYVRDVDGRSPAEWLTGMDGFQYPAEWLEDGSMTLFSREETGAQTDILLARVGSDEAPVPLLIADWDESSPRVSPDGTLMAYTSNETGERHVFVREFPGMGGRWQVSAAPARGPLVWARDGNAIFYHDNRSAAILRADLQREPNFEVLRRAAVTDERGTGILRDIHPDGRILISRDVGQAAFEELEEDLMVVVNWFTQLRQRLGDPDV